MTTGAHYSLVGTGTDPVFFFFFFFNFIEVWLIYKVVVISAVQQSDSVIHTYIYSLAYSFPLWFITGY